MRVLIVGGTRFVGYFLTWRLLAAGHRLTLVNRGSRPDPFGNRVERLVADRTTPEFAELLAKRSFDVVYDFAGYTANDARQSVEIFGRGRVGHYIFISSGQVYLVREGCPTPSREEDYAGALTPRPSDPYDLDEWLYGVGKREAEVVLADAWAIHGCPATRIRHPMVNGERDHFRRIESYLRRILDGGPVLLPDGGAQVARHIYSGSLVRALADLAGNSAAIGQVYNLCQDEEPTVAELVGILCDILGAPQWLISVPTSVLAEAGLRPMDVSPYSDRWMSHLDPAKSRRDLGFRHEPLRSYLEKIVVSFVAHPPAEPPENYANRPKELALAAWEDGTA